MEEYKSNIIALTPTNFHLWLKEIRGVARKAQVLKYVDPDGGLEEPQRPICPHYSDYEVDEPPAPLPEEGTLNGPPNKRPAKKYREFTDEQKEDYKIEMHAYEIAERTHDRIHQGIRLVDAAIKSSARPYITSTWMESNVRDVLIQLQQRYDRSNVEILRQIHEQFRILKTNAPTKNKIEEWVAEWKNMRNTILDKKLKGLFGEETLFISEFLDADRVWTPLFCDTWVQQKEAAHMEMDFFETTRQYRVAVERALKNVRIGSAGHAYAAFLQRIQQNQKVSRNDGSNDGRNDGRNNGKRCVCGEVHLFNNCSYICISARQSG